MLVRQHTSEREAIERHGVRKAGAVVKMANSFLSVILSFSWPRLSISQPASISNISLKSSGKNQAVFLPHLPHIGVPRNTVRLVLRIHGLNYVPAKLPSPNS